MRSKPFPFGGRAGRERPAETGCSIASVRARDPTVTTGSPRQAVRRLRVGTVATRMSALVRAQFAYFYSLRRLDGATLRRTLRSPSGGVARFVFGTRFRARVGRLSSTEGIGL